MPEEPITQEMRIVQGARERAERTAAEDAPLEDEAAQHARRADRAAYLREKLEDRAESERAAG
jgi:hypothetical protein